MALSHGGRNLLILAAGSTAFALATTSISLLIYHYSGDIYLDRSRPGFLPDEKEEAENQRHDTKYTFPDNGPIDDSAIDEYLKEIQPSLDTVNQLPDPYSSDPLSDESLGIPASQKEQKDT